MFRFTEFFAENSVDRNVTESDGICNRILWGGQNLTDSYGGFGNLKRERAVGVLREGETLIL